jgi:hypothetical protein
VTPLPLLAAVLVAGAVLVVVLLVVLLVRRRRTPVVPAGPRTVAELVEMRAATAPTRVTAPPPPEPEPVAADVPEAAEPATAPAAPAAAPAVAAPPEPVAVAPAPPAPPAGPVTLLGADVPWRRGALMSGASAGLPEPRPAATAPASPVRVAVARPVTVAAPRVGSTRRDLRAAVPVPTVPAPSPPVVTAPPRAPAPVVDPPRSGSSAAPAPGRSVPPRPERSRPEQSAAESPAVDATVSEPPASRPPLSEPPVSEPPVTEPPATVLRPTAEQAAADLALLRTFGAVDLASRPDRAPDVALASAARPEPEPEPGAAQPVRFRVVRRGGEPITEAAVALLDAGGREAAAASGACGELLAPRPGRYMLVATAAGHQAGALAVGVADAPVEAELLLVRSAVLRGLVTDEDGPVPGARVTLVQDGEVVETADSDRTGAYRVDGLAAGEYAVSVAAAGCEPDVELVLLPDEAEVVHDVDLVPAGVAAGWGTDGG